MLSWTIGGQWAVREQGAVSWTFGAGWELGADWELGSLMVLCLRRWVVAFSADGGRVPVRSSLLTVCWPQIISVSFAPTLPDSPGESRTLPDSPGLQHAPLPDSPGLCWAVSFPRNAPPLLRAVSSPRAMNSSGGPITSDGPAGLLTGGLLIAEPPAEFYVRFVIFPAKQVRLSFCLLLFYSNDLYEQHDVSSFFLTLHMNSKNEKNIS
ncbi:hypothetical protein T492DRAFT_4882 [Pavlovales sp. CCMP2436]|nr:hypothetical protein T492DRAFT_4882 [Pavlovales sp. CCMP2436]